MDSVYSFSLKNQAASSNYKFYIQLRHSTSYAYSNIYFFLTTQPPSGEARYDTIECQLADRFGNWYGKGMGRLRENRYLIRNPMTLNDTGTYVISLEQAMRDTLLPGVSDIGIRLELLK